MSDKEISLELSNDYGAVPASPMSDSKREPDYPTFHYEGKIELDLPDEGVMEIRFRKVSETSSVNKSGEHWYACTIEVQSILEVESEDEEEGEDEPSAPYSSKAKSTEDALDKILETMQEMVKKDEEVHDMMEE